MAITKGILGYQSAFDERYIPDYDELKETVGHLQGLGNEVVLTMGVWDMIHRGHGRYLELARDQGDVLVVGVDSDDLTKKRKGDNRPIVPHEERLEMLTLLRSVDLVTLRDIEHGMDTLVQVLEPDVLVVSETTEDLGEEKIAEFEGYCGRVEVLQPQAQTSTTERIRQLAISGKSELAKDLWNVLDDHLPGDNNLPQGIEQKEESDNE